MFNLECSTKLDTAFRNKLRSLLLSKYHLNTQQLQQLDKYLDTPLLSSDDISNLNSQAQTTIDNATTNASQVGANASMRQSIAQETINRKATTSSRIEQDSKVSLKFPEPQFKDTKFTNPKNLKDANSSFADNYPHTTGIANQNTDFFKIDRKTGDLQIVHHSGTCIKIDNDGNVTINTKGSLKQIVEGDYSLQVNGGMDLSVAKGLYIHSKQDLIIEAQDNLNTQAQNTTIQSQSGQTNTTPKITTNATQIQATSSTLQVKNSLATNNVVGKMVQAQQVIAPTLTGNATSSTIAHSIG